MLGRLLELDHQRYEEEVKVELHRKKQVKGKAKAKTRRKSAGKQGDRQLSFLNE